MYRCTYFFVIKFDNIDTFIRCVWSNFSYTLLSITNLSIDNLMRFPVGNDPNFWLVIYLFICQIKFVGVIQGVTTQTVNIFVTSNQRWYHVKIEKSHFSVYKRLVLWIFFEANTRTAEQLVIGQFVVKSKQTHLPKYLYLPITKPPSRIGLWNKGTKFKHWNGLVFVFNQNTNTYISLKTYLITHSTSETRESRA